MIGDASGSGGTLELAGGSDKITGLGSYVMLTGGASGGFYGFGTYQVDGGASVTLGGANTVAAGQTIAIAGGAIEGAAGATLTNSGLINGEGSVAGAMAIINAASGGAAMTLGTAGLAQTTTVAELPLDGDNGASASGAVVPIDTTSTVPNVPQTFPADETITGMTINPSLVRRSRSRGTSSPRMNFEVRKSAETRRTAILARAIASWISSNQFAPASIRRSFQVSSSRTPR